MSIPIEKYEGVFRLPEEFTGEGEFFVMPVKGDGLIEAGILNGDYLVLREQDTAKNGDIIVAQPISETEFLKGAVLRRYKQKNGRFVLCLENVERKDADLPAAEYRVLGKLVSLMRKIDVEVGENESRAS